MLRPAMTMDARVYFHLVDSIAAADDAVTLSAVRDLIGATVMHRIEREALERTLSSRERSIRTSEIELNRPASSRGD